VGFEPTISAGERPQIYVFLLHINGYILNYILVQEAWTYEHDIWPTVTLFYHHKVFLADDRARSEQVEKAYAKIRPRQRSVYISWY